jgi:hypothetical protein
VKGLKGQIQRILADLRYVMGKGIYVAIQSANVPNVYWAALGILYPNCRSLGPKSPVSRETEIKAIAVITIVAHFLFKGGTLILTLPSTL